MMQAGFQISGEDMEQLGVIIYHGIKSAYKVDGIVGGDAEYKDKWERTRFLVLTVLLLYQKRGKRLRPTDIAKFPWDSTHDKTTSDDLERISALFGED